MLRLPAVTTLAPSPSQTAVHSLNLSKDDGSEPASTSTLISASSLAPAKKSPAAVTHNNDGLKATNGTTSSPGKTGTLAEPLAPCSGIVKRSWMSRGRIGAFLRMRDDQDCVAPTIQEAASALVPNPPATESKPPSPSSPETQVAKDTQQTDSHPATPAVAQDTQQDSQSPDTQAAKDNQQTDSLPATPAIAQDTQQNSQSAPDAPQVDPQPAAPATNPAPTDPPIIVQSQTVPANGNPITINSKVVRLSSGYIYVGSSAAPIPQVQTFHPASPSPVQPSSVVVGGLIFSAAQSEPSVESSTASDQPEAEPVVVGGKEYAPIAPTSQSETSQVAGNTPEQGGSESSNPQEQSDNEVHNDHTEPDDLIPQPAQADSTPIVIGGITYTPVPSNPTSPPQSAAVLSLAPTASLLAIGQQTLTALPGGEVGFEIDQSTLLPGGSALSISGQIYSINGADSLIVGTSTIPLATVGSSNMSNGALTAGGETFTPLGSTAVVVDGSTISVGGSAITVNGTRLSLASNGLLVGSSTFAYATPVVNTTTVSTASSSTFSTGISPGSGVISTTFPSATGGPGRSGASAKVITRRGLAIWVGMSMSLSMVTGLL